MASDNAVRCNSILDSSHFWHGLSCMCTDRTAVHESNDEELLCCMRHTIRLHDCRDLVQASMRQSIRRK